MGIYDDFVIGTLLSRLLDEPHGELLVAPDARYSSLDLIQDTSYLRVLYCEAVS